MQADIYSFGVLLWEIVTRETPLRGHLRHAQVPVDCQQVLLGFKFRSGSGFVTRARNLKVPAEPPLVRV